MFTWRVLLAMSALCILVAFPASSQPDQDRSQKYWIYFEKDTDVSSTDRQIVSEYALQRRARRGSGVPASIDHQLSSRYLKALEAHGVSPVATSRWFNAVSAYLSAEQVDTVVTFPFVRAVRPVLAALRATGLSAGVNVPETLFYADAHAEWRAVPEWNADVLDGLGPAGPLALDFGPAETQLAIVNAIRPLEAGIDGSGVRLGFLDTPYLGLSHSSLNHLHTGDRLVEIRDFTGLQQTDTHGQSVVSVAAGFEEGHLIGPAHGAKILAATTEYVPTETNAEEDYFVAGLEWLEAQGVDVVNVSLGYTTFDPGERDYAYHDLDGDSGITTRAVDRAAALGVVVVAAIGNEACDSPENCWYYVGTPADADSVIAVGGVNADRTRASFSSFGPTADGRIKPDVAALGSSVYVAVPGGYARTGGTSFASPMVAGIVSQILQVNPNLGPIEIRDLLRRTADQSEAPDNELGWGIVNADLALQTATALSLDGTGGETVSVSTFPNPATDFLFVHITPQTFHTPLIRIYDVLGRRIDAHVADLEYSSDRTISLSTGGLSSGVYFISVHFDEVVVTGKFTVLR